MSVIKYFTNISIPNEGEKLLSMADKLIELDLLNEILALLPEDELLKMTEVVNKFSKSVEAMASEKEQNDALNTNEEE